MGQCGGVTKISKEEHVTEVLTQDEIDQLLTAINGGGDFTSAAFENIEEFEGFLTKRKFDREKPYGIFEKDVTVCRFFNNEKNENLLEDIRRKNEEQKYGNIKIPNTNVTLINFSFCHNCKTVFSLMEITDYYKNPVPDPAFKNRAHQYRNDTRVCCKTCGTYFLPSLVISDGTPKNEVQFLCRVQTIDAVEKYFAQKDLRVLTKNKNNVLQRNGQKAIKNDVYIKHLDEKPSLVTNIIQYTPINLIMNLIDGSNVEKGDLLFDEWK